MTESRPVPVLIVGWKYVPSPLHHEWTCHCCAFAASGRSEAAVTHAMEAHARYINAHADRATDPHFADVRLDALIHG